MKRVILSFFFMFIFSMQIYADNKKSVTVAIDYDYAPFTFKSFEGKPEGLLVEIWRLWEKKSGYEVKFKFYSWDDSIEAVEKSKVIFHSGLDPDKKWMAVGKKIYELKTAFFKLEGRELPTKLKIGSIDSSYAKYAKKIYPNATIIKYDDYLPMIKDAIDKKIDIFIDDEIAIYNYLLQKKVKAKFEPLENSFLTGVFVVTNQENRKFIKLFNKYFDKIEQKELARVESAILGKNYYFKVKNRQKITSSISLKELIVSIVSAIVIFVILFSYLAKYKNRFSIFPIVVMVAIFTLSVTFITNQSINRLKENRLNKMESALKSTAKIVRNSILKNIKNFKNSTTLTVALLKGKHNGVEKILKKVKEINNFKNISIISKDLKAVYGEFDGTEIVDKSFLKAIKRAKLEGFSTILPHKDNSDFIFINSINLKDKTLFLVSVADSSNIIDIIGHSHIGESGKIYLINSNDEFITKDNFNNQSKSPKAFHIFKAPYTLKEFRDDPKSSYIDYRGIKVFGAWVLNKDYSFKVVSEIDEKEVLSTFNELKKSIYIVVFSSISFTVLLLFSLIWFFNKNSKILNKKNEELEELSKNLEKRVLEQTKELNLHVIELKKAHKQTKDSIEYASLIQSAIMPDNLLFKEAFKDYFIIWQPKDVVGGDIYLFERLRGEDEFLLMVIDCTGHGVAGAFVTMLVKAIEKQIVAKIDYDNEPVSPAKILSIFNKTMKQLLKQESKDSISDAGFDGGVIYYNKREKIVKFAGSKMELFYVKNGELVSIKGDRHSIGYKRSDPNYAFKEHTIVVDSKIKFYATTDGYIDQNGGKKGFSFGKRRFKEIIKDNHFKSMFEQKEIFLQTLNSYQKDEERNDDITVVGFEV